MRRNTSSLVLLFASIVGFASVLGCTNTGGGAGGSGAGSSTSTTGSSSTGGAPPIGAATCDPGDLFVDAIADGAWVNLDVDPSGGTAAIRDALTSARDDHPNEAVRIRLAPGTYADNVGGEIYAQHVLRTATTPILVVATDPSPNATTLLQGFNLVGVAYVAFDGLTIGPSQVGAWNGSAHADPQPVQAQAGIHVAGSAIAGGTSAVAGDGSLDTNVFGKYEPSHHIVVRNCTIQNVFGSDAESGELALGADNDGMKFNQAEYVWVLGNSITQTSRHGIDNVGVHHAVFCGNAISRNGGGLGLEAKGGSYDVVFEGNLFYRVRRVALGGETTDATYYFSVDGAYDYEGKAIVARNNVIIDPRESALQFSGCAACAAVGNTILYTAGYVPPLTDAGDANGGDAMRLTESVILSAADGAGSDCVSWDEAAKDYVYYEQCWGVGSNAPAPVGRALLPRENVVVDNAFLSMAGVWSPSFGGPNPNPEATPCPLQSFTDAPSPFASVDGNYWFNAGKPLAACSPLSEGAASVTDGADPLLPNAAVDDAQGVRALAVLVSTALAPSTGSPLVDKGIANPPNAVPYDYAGVDRGPAFTIGALEGK